MLCNDWLCMESASFICAADSYGMLQYLDTVANGPCIMPSNMMYACALNKRLEHWYKPCVQPTLRIWLTASSSCACTTCPHTAPMLFSGPCMLTTASLPSFVCPLMAQARALASFSRLVSNSCTCNVACACPCSGSGWTCMTATMYTHSYRQPGVRG